MQHEERGYEAKRDAKSRISQQSSRKHVLPSGTGFRWELASRHHSGKVQTKCSVQRKTSTTLFNTPMKTDTDGVNGVTCYLAVSSRMADRLERMRLRTKTPLCSKEDKRGQKRTSLPAMSATPDEMPILLLFHSRTDLPWRLQIGWSNEYWQPSFIMKSTARQQT